MKPIVDVLETISADLKADRRNPDPALRPTLGAHFDTIFTQRTSHTILDRTLGIASVSASTGLRVPLSALPCRAFPVPTEGSGE